MRHRKLTVKVIAILMAMKILITTLKHEYPLHLHLYQLLQYHVNNGNDDNDDVGEEDEY